MKDIKFANYHPPDQIIGDWTKGVKTISSFKDLASYTLLSEIKPKTLDEAVTDDDWNIAMEEELH